MQKRLFSTKANPSIALVGISKNSGKTTLLNHIVASFPHLTWGVLSTGLDGEIQDRLFHTPKPRVILPQGALFCADGPVATGHGSSVSILAKENYGGRKLWYLRAEQDLQTEITGPATAALQMQMAQKMKQLGASAVLIDGSLDRKSIAFEEGVDEIIVCVGASFGTKEEVVEELKRLSLLIDIPSLRLDEREHSALLQSGSPMFYADKQWHRTAFESLINHENELKKILADSPEALYIPGAYTERVHEKLFGSMSKLKQLVFRHPQCLSLGHRKLQNLINRCPTYTLIPFKVRLFALNPWAAGRTAEDAVLFRAYVRKHFLQHELIDVMELEA